MKLSEAETLTRQQATWGAKSLEVDAGHWQATTASVAAEVLLASEVEIEVELQDSALAVNLKFDDSDQPGDYSEGSLRPGPGAQARAAGLPATGHRYQWQQLPVTVTVAARHWQPALQLEVQAATVPLAVAGLQESGHWQVATGTDRY